MTRDEAISEDLAQEVFVKAYFGLDRFEGRSSLKTWIFRILTNIAKTRGQREGRTVPFSALERPDAGLVTALCDAGALGAQH